MSKLAKKVTLATGVSRDGAAAIAQRLTADRASVAITRGENLAAASAVVKAIEPGGGKANVTQADAADAEASKNAVEESVAAFNRLDVFVNKAGAPTGIGRAAAIIFAQTTAGDLL